ncbi:adenosylcobinamide-GDP ribazoletransferase [Paenibacillus sp. MZ04-78.2]|uniref:adenosylcobinamide-GDP ribazoletransferase n=1 Tax=Paenibacillus sp. MZ04-78.2 TaxID=2962034 RepID=UPI0020B7C1B5|nr:adenosylcobinamide-GDP ribazoletransferase [Paenibacillus sp. MZ04-78.2]MCP3773712.1 adenosylcobinamide-GDP ribazoletransferase [Paenibacillus sp. MZ04-78.2]
MRAFIRLIRLWGEACAAAFQFLSRLPVPVKLDSNDALFRRSVVFYPLVGLVLGLITAAAGLLLTSVLPPLPAAALLLGIWVLLTGALHLDGLMDTADGILSHRSRERMLEIMKDSRVGAMGVIAAVLVLLLKWSLLAEMLPAAAAGSQWNLWLLLALVPLWSRWYMVVAIACWPYARQAGSGMGGFFRGVGAGHAVGSGLVALLLSLCVVAAGEAFGGLSLPFWHMVGIIVILLAVTMGAGVLISVSIHRKLGGLTGDTYGAMNELLEAALLLVLVLIKG